jgi:flagellar hook-associated protein 3 FlgL
MTIQSFLPAAVTFDRAQAARARIDRLASELASGQVADRGRAVGSDFSSLSRLTHDLGTAEARRVGLARAADWTGQVQAGLGQVGRIVERLGGGLLSSGAGHGAADAGLLAAMGRDALADMLTVLGGRQDGRALFGNGATGASLLPGADDLIGAVRALVVAAPDMESALGDIDAFFASGGDFETTHMAAFDAAPVRFASGQGQSVAVAIDLDDPALRGALRDAAIVAVSEALPGAGDATGRAAFVEAMAPRIAGTGSGLIGLQARIGATEARIAGRLDAHAGETIELERRVAEIVAADPYETATRLQEEMSRLESTYALTARRARLRLTEYMR